jgi:FMN phosphatase YigB (HAD superfamily)
MNFPNHVAASALERLLDSAPTGVSVLSLDCFDTLIWRNCHAPADVFTELGLPGGATYLRGRAEGRARQTARFEGGAGEVSIGDIYRSLGPAGEAEIDAAVARELDAEARHCFAFAPTVALMRAARVRGLQVVIVSDTYLDEDQLGALIEAAGGADVRRLIDRIFCSSTYGKSKAAGLFEPVIAALGVPAEAIVHVGDNKTADLTAPAALGIQAIHFRQFDPECEQRLRLEAAAATIIDPAIRIYRPALQPHRAALSLRSEADPVAALGHDVLGPIMHAFARWIEAEAAALEAESGRPTKILFLLRDGHLPQRVFEAVTGKPAAAAELSRYTARRASFTDEKTIRDYLASQDGKNRIAVLARQLGLNRTEGEKLGKQGRRAFERAVLTPAWVRRIVERSTAFADKLFAHLAAQGITRGDSVMFVDLGYNGSVQNHAQPVLHDRFGLAISGRYLLLREERRSGLDKKGLLDVRHFDSNALHALCGPIAVIEQLATIALGSVADYGPDGAPFRKAAGAKGAQNEIRDRVQQACVEYARDEAAAIHRPPASDDGDARRQMTAGILARLLFLPTATEVKIFEAFEHDVNLGTDDMLQMLDLTQSSEGLRRHGCLYLNGAERMYLPGELQPHGLPFNLTLLSSQRFGLDLRGADLRGSALRLPVMLVDDRAQTMTQIDAHATHDGYHVALIPVGAGRFAAGIQLGGLCDWVQIDEAAFYPVARFTPQLGAEPCTPIPATIIREGMTEEAPGLYRCTEGALMMAPPLPSLAKEPHLLAITFRPLLRRATEALRKAA